MTVQPGQLKGVGDLVHVGIEKGQDCIEVACTVALCVVVVDEYESIIRIELSPRFTVVSQIRHTLSAILSNNVPNDCTMSKMYASNMFNMFFDMYNVFT